MSLYKEVMSRYTEKELRIDKIMMDRSCDERCMYCGIPNEKDTALLFSPCRGCGAQWLKGGTYHAPGTQGAFDRIEGDGHYRIRSRKILLHTSMMNTPT